MPNQQNQGNFVERFEMAAMQYVILNKAMQGEVTKENLQQTFKGNLQMKSDHLDHCIDELVKEKHVTRDGNKLRITDDGREDVNEVQRLAIELSNITQQGGGGQQRTQSAQTTTQGATTSNVGGTNQPGQPKGGPGASSGNR